MQVTGQRRSLGRNTFLKAAFAHERIRIVVNNRVFGSIEAGSKHGFCHRHTDGNGNTLSQRAGGTFHAVSDADFRVTGAV